MHSKPRLGLWLRMRSIDLRFAPVRRSNHICDYRISYRSGGLDELSPLLTDLLEASCDEDQKVWETHWRKLGFHCGLELIVSGGSMLVFQIRCIG